MASRKNRVALINMDPSIEDPTYRYTMERVMTRSEGKNTGKVTVITNIESISDSIIGTLMMSSDDDPREYPPRKQILRKTVEDVIKFLRRKIGGKVQFKKNRKVAVISGEHDLQYIQSLIFEYIRRFTICPQCNNPELTPAVLSPVVCRSCGYSVGKKSWKNSGKKQGKRSNGKTNRKSDGKHNGKSDGKSSTKSVHKNTEITVDSVEEEKENEMERTHRRREKKKEKIKQRLSEDPIFALNHFVDNLNFKEQEFKDISCDDIMEKIKILSLAHSLNREKQIKMVVHCLLKYGNESDEYHDDDGHKVLMESIKKYRPILVQYTLEDGDSDILMGYLEELVMIRSVGDHLLNRFHLILECLYEYDIVDEEEILRWYESLDTSKGFRIVSFDDAKEIRQKAVPFIKWLKEAEEEEDEDDENTSDKDDSD